MVSASMGVYVFNTGVLLQAIAADAADSASSHDFGKDVIPGNLSRYRVVAYDFIDLNKKSVRYWRDVGTIDAFYDANMDLVSVSPEFNLYDDEWPVRTRLAQQPPAKLSSPMKGGGWGGHRFHRLCRLHHFWWARGAKRPFTRSAGEQFLRGRGLHFDASLRNRPVQPRAARHHRFKSESSEGSNIGFSLEEDRKKGYHVTDSGIVVVPS